MTHNLTATRLGLVLAVLAGVLLGAIFGQPSTGRAASTAIPKNTSLPTISGTPAVGSTLTANPGKWTGTPTSFSYRWKLCDTSGNSCANIVNGTSKAYTVTQAASGHTLRVTVTARNASGSASATSAPTAVVGQQGCPSGSGVIQVSQLSPPQRLQIDSGTSSPSVVRRSASSVSIRFTVTACGTRPVQGATVYAAAVPFNQFAPASGTTGADGTATLHEARQSGFPVSRHQHLLVVFVRATKPGESPLDGVSTRRLVSFPVR